MRLWLIVAVTCMVVAFALPIRASAVADRSMNFPAVAASAPPTLDGTLSDPQWQTATSAHDFLDVTTRQPAPLSTDAYLLYDKDNLYVGFRAEQAGHQIVAQQTTNNVGFGLDDFVGIGLDPGADGAQVYYFEVTPRGVRYQQSTESSRYNPPWRASAHVSGTKWTATMVIPLKDLRAGSAPVQRWRFNFIRGVAIVGEHYTWAFDGLMQDGQPPQWPDSRDSRYWPGLTDVRVSERAGRPLPHIDAYGLASLGRDRERFQQANGSFATQTPRNAGFDLTYPFTNTMAFVGTLAPDFSNVEVDQQTIAPQEFRRNLTEYRPFLAQGANFFHPNLATISDFAPSNVLFYSPGIGAFDRGTKAEGTFGSQSLGILNVKGVGFDDTAFGLGHALPDRTFLWWTDGVLAHHTGVSDTSLEGGFAGRNLHNGFVYAFNTGGERGSIVPNVSLARTYDGYVDVHKPNYEAFADYHDVGPFFNPVDGFTTVSDVRGLDGHLFFNGTGSKAVKSWDSFIAGDRLFDRSPAVHEADFFSNTDVTFRNLIRLSPFFGMSELRLYDCGAPIACYPAYGPSTILPFDQSGLGLGYRDGTPAPFDLTYSTGPFAGAYLQQFTSTTSRTLGTRLSVTLEYDGTRERFFSGGADSQNLRRVALGESLGADTNVSIAFRSINGTGGFAAPGSNVAAAYHQRFGNGDELYIDYGTPAASVTLDRLIVKFVLHFGGGVGT